MNDKLVFSKIENNDIFCGDFLEFKKNNVIEFSINKIAVLYGPNGIGKSSLAKVLNRENGTAFNAEFNDTSIEDDEDYFNIIEDQNHRNIIKGEASDYLLGDDIRRKQELKEQIEKEKEVVFDSLGQKLKDEFNIAKKSSKLLKEVKNCKIQSLIENIANSKIKVSEIDIEKFIKIIISLVSEKNDNNHEEEKLNFLKNDFENKDSIIKKILDLDSSEINKNEEVREIEEHDEAIKILEKFNYIDDCIVCDTAIKRAILLASKTTDRKDKFEKLDKKTKKILKEIVMLMDSESNDSFNIKTILLDAIKEGNGLLVDNLKSEIEHYFIIFNKQINNLFFDCLRSSNLEKIYQEREEFNKKSKFNDEDLSLIRDIISANIEKNITVDWSDDSMPSFKLENDDFLGKDRNNIPLSTGEQNFISLAFELLKARKSDRKIIVLDDPISSFDSIYKNKIVYCIVNILKYKHQIILTHNTELIKLLEHQHSNCSNLYLFNNKEAADNGFIRVNKKEQNILLYLDKLLDLFRNKDIISEIQNEKLFLISMIPFMRGYAQILDEKEIKNELTKLMHGYNDESVNLADMYEKLFGIKIMSKCMISAKDICGLEDIERKILKPYTEFKLLENTLYHNLVYLYLRLNVEKVLVEEFMIDTKEYNLLGSIINKAFGEDNRKMEDKDRSENRRKFLSKKTLLNEFNHFEGNMNIFQPAIDISDSALENEKKEIIKLLEELKKEGY